MAKVMVEYDTAEKTLVATMDGVPIEDIRELVFEPSYERKGDWAMGLLQKKCDDEGGTQTWTRTMARATPVQRAVASLFGWKSEAS